MERAREMVIVPQEVISSSVQVAVRTAPKSSSVANSVKDGGSDSGGGGGGGSLEENSTQSPGDTLSRLDAEMYKILRSNEFSNARKKCKNYLQVLRRYLFFKDQHERNEQAASAAVASAAANSNDSDSDESAAAAANDRLAPPTPPTLTEASILRRVPKIHARKVKLLLRHWDSEAPGRLTWDRTGAITLDGRKIEGTSIVKLLKDFVRKRRSDDANEERAAPVGRELFARFVATAKTPSELINNTRILEIGYNNTKPNRKKRAREAAIIGPFELPPKYDDEQPLAKRPATTATTTGAREKPTTTTRRRATSASAFTTTTTTTTANKGGEWLSLKI